MGPQTLGHEGFLCTVQMSWCCSDYNKLNGTDSNPHSSSDKPFFESKILQMGSFPAASLALVKPQTEAPRASKEHSDIKMG